VRPVERVAENQRTDPLEENWIWEGEGKRGGGGEKKEGK